MLEIILLVHLGKRLAAKARRRGWPGWPWVVLLVFGWLAALLVGAIMTTVAYLATHPGEQEAPLGILLLGMYGLAACFATGLFVVVGFLPADPPEEDDEEWDESPADLRPAVNDPYAEYDRRYTSDEDEERRYRRR